MNSNHIKKNIEKNKYVKNLSVGEHTLKVAVADGEAGMISVGVIYKKS